MSTDLADRKCVPCRGGVPPLTRQEMEPLLARVSEWQAEADKKLVKEFRFKNFAEALDFVNRIGAVAEEEGHHPDLYLAWGLVRVYIWTHKIDGLTESDFILAAKIDRLGRSAETRKPASPQGA